MLGQSQEDKILDAAYACLARDGYAQVSLRQIAQEAGVALSQISYHFENKEGLLLAVVTHVADNFQSQMEACLKTEMAPRQKAERLIAFYQDVLKKDPGLFKVLYDMAGLSLWSEALRLQVWSIFGGMVRQITEEVFTRDLVSEIGSEHTPEALASMFFGALFGIALMVLTGPNKESILTSLSAILDIFKPYGEVI